MIQSQKNLKEECHDWRQGREKTDEADVKGDRKKSLRA